MQWLHFDPGVFTGYLLTAIAADGYQVVPIAVSRGSGYFSNYGALKGADAWLDCVGRGWGYVAGGVGKESSYRPGVELNCRLVSASDQTILMREIISYSSFENKLGITISPDSNYAFVDFDALTADPGKAAAGIDAALRTSAKVVGTLLR